MLALIDQQVTLCQRLDELMAASEAGVIGWQVCHESEGVERAFMPCARRRRPGWAVPKARRKPIPFAEDTLRGSPEQLADYICMGSCALLGGTA